ncbi:uncharacterized protein LOC104916164 isoform X2 [Meleagris gallopavo]|nr:uncharacterized protein LOC104916164 isoform X2 [Meleagris gallopavo]
MKAQEGRVINSMLLSITEGSSGTYKCLYQQRNEEDRLRSSALSPPRDLHVTGHVSGSTEGTATADPSNQLASTVTVVASVTIILLLSAATFWTIKKGACRERCRCVGSAEESSADCDSYYANVDEMRRVKVSCALPEACS